MVQALNKSGQIKSSSFTSGQLKSVVNGDEKSRVEALKELLDYPIIQLDPQGSRFWYLRPGVSEEQAKEICPIAVGFYSELNDHTDREIRNFLTSKDPQPEIYRHYIGRAGDIENQPVMYLLLPKARECERVVLVLPTEGGIRQRQIQIFAWSDRELSGRLERLKQANLKIASRGIAEIPLIDWVFYPGVKTAQKLAQLMADIARDIERLVPTVAQNQGKSGYLHKLFLSFKKELLPTLELKADDDKDYSFADIYAQTIAYGLFTARVFSYIKFKQYQAKHPGYDIEPDFYRDNAWKFLPETNPFLRKLFQEISKPEVTESLGEELIGAVSELLSVLRAAEMEAVLLDFRQKIGQEDIIIRFYENFLDAYKPQMRERRGVYYTPQPVVSYIVRSVDYILKQDFALTDGLADATKISTKSTDRKKPRETHKVLITDPAVGTGTFLHEVIDRIHQSFEAKPEQWSDYVSADLLPRLLGFELLMAPYAVAHMKLGLQLAELGYKFDREERLGVYLTNSLQEAFQIPQNEEHLSKLFWGEADAANRIKETSPVMVILGNPPYSGHSANNGDWIKNLLRGKDTVTEQLCSNYFEVDGEPLGERNPKWLNDDYVKFIRFGQWRIERTGYGVLAFVTNHSYLDNPTFRGMRQSLMNTFDDIYVLDLHGNSKKKESCPDGSKDENVFDIQQGVSINIFVKHPNGNKKKATVHHADLWGKRDYKYNWLEENDLTTTQWNTLQPQSEFYLFVPQDNDLKAEYENGWKVTDIFPVNSVGIVTGQDKKTIGITQKEAKILADSHGLSEDTIDPILYRPFDRQFIVYDSKVVTRPRAKVMRHMLAGENLGLIFMRQAAIQGSYNHFLVTNNIVDNRAFYSNKGIMQQAPLYIYPDINNSKQLLIEERSQPNISQNFFAAFKSNLGYNPTPENIFYYIYAVFHSSTYRDRYSEYLKRDFPRIPLTSNDELFHQLADYGEQLVQLHLMTSPKLDNLITEFVEGTGEHTVAKGHPKYQNGAVQINKKGDKFTGVPEEVWNFYVGGYQVCHKWLKDRKGRRLSDEDILHYQKIVVALKETIELMNQIDEAIPSFPIK